MTLVSCVTSASANRVGLNGEISIRRLFAAHYFGGYQPGGRGMHEAMAGEAGDMEHAANFGIIADDRLVVRGRFIEPGPLVGDLGGLQLRDAVEAFSMIVST